MANVKICDKCGKKIEPKMWPIVVTSYMSVLGMVGEEEEYTYELCKSCMKEVQKFIEPDIDDEDLL